QSWQKIVEWLQESQAQVQRGLPVDLRDLSAEVDKACQAAMALSATEREAMLDSMRAVVQQLDGLEALIKAQKDLVVGELSNLTQRGRAMNAYLNAGANNAASNPNTPANAPDNTPVDTTPKDSSNDTNPV
ncbi:MAG: hypothetical protein ACK5WY_05580, partial [Holosporaceae bacterium]